MNEVTDDNADTIVVADSSITVTREYLKEQIAKLDQKILTNKLDTNLITMELKAFKMETDAEISHLVKMNKILILITLISNFSYLIDLLIKRL